MSSAQELVREVRDEVAELEGIGERLSKLDAALAEMERDQPFIEAAEKAAILCELYEAHVIRKYLGEQSGQALIDLIAVHRKRREGRGKDASE